MENTIKHRSDISPRTATKRLVLPIFFAPAIDLPDFLLF